MKTTISAVCALAMLAGTASADFIPLPSGHQMLSVEALSAQPLDAAQTRGTAVYSSIPGPYAALVAGAFANRDDYTTNMAGTGNFSMDVFVFVGGVQQVGGILDIFMLDNANNVVSSFGVALPQAGDFIWTITLATPINAAKSGQVQIQSGAGTTGRWFATSTAASIGSNSFASGHGSTFSTGARIAAFELQAIPAPGAAALLGLGGLLASRRRR